MRLASRRWRRRGTRRSSVKLRGLGRVHPHDRDPGGFLSRVAPAADAAVRGEGEADLGSLCNSF